MTDDDRGPALPSTGPPPGDLPGLPSSSVLSLPEREALAAAILAVPGVSGVQVDPDPYGGPGVLRITLAAGVDEVQVATAVNKVLRLQFGVTVDAGRVELVEESVAERAPHLSVVPEPDDGLEFDAGPGLQSLLEAVERRDRLGAPAYPVEVLPSALRHPSGAAPRPPQPAPELPLPGEQLGPRLAIARLVVAPTDAGVEATVTLAHAQQWFAGAASGPLTEPGVIRAVAEATLAAVSSAVGGVDLVVDIVEVAAVGPRQVAVVQVLMRTGLGTDRLTGASDMREDARQAVVRATLDAVNRRLEHLITA